ncbi:MAG: hypothetical protein WKF45_10320 [Ilumatobacteraceae bacterium]
MSLSLAADAAAVTATMLSAFGAVPQLRRIAATGDIAGVSAATAALGVTTELTWFAYSADESLWTAMPEAVLMAVANMALLVLVCGRGATWRPPVFGAIGWAVVLAGIGVAGGTRTLGPVLGAAYLVQVAPAVRDRDADADRPGFSHGDRADSATILMTGRVVATPARRAPRPR